MSMGGDENARNSTLTAKPDVLAWRGRFTIRNRDIDIKFKASKSTKACPVVLDLAGFMPDTLCLEMVPLVDVWPSHLHTFEANEFSIDLFFLPEERDNDVLDSLLTDVISTDSALKAVIRGGFDLLVFTSLHLPEKLHRLDGKVYFWGLFMRKSASSHKENPNLDIQNNGGTLDLGSDPSDNTAMEISEVYNSDEHRALKIKRTGRKFDDAWVHAEPFDSLQKTKAQCKYCGFITKYGGISRLKAHLAGNNPWTPVCDKVSPEVRKEMADWYKKWARNSKFPWVSRCQGSDRSISRSFDVEKSKEITSEQIAMKSTDQVKRMGRKFDDAWVHAEPFDSLQKTKAQCKYCGFITKYGGIARLKAHLAGKNPWTPVCDKVSPEVRKEMADWYKKWARYSKATWVPGYRGTDRSESRSFDVEKSEEITSEQRATNPVDIMRKRNGRRPLDAAWAHAERLNDNNMGARCNYCGFISRYGTIARLKVHLSGESPRVPACLKVPQEIKEDMAGWFREWVKTAKPVWLMCSQGNSEHVQAASKRQLDEVDAWEHVIKLDENGERIKCMHCDFVSKHGRIECMIVHLSGGDPEMQLKGCPNVSPEELNYSNKKTKHINMPAASSREDWRS